MPLSEGALLTLEHVGRQHAGTYQCKAENGVRNPVYAEVNLKVLCKLKFFFVIIKPAARSPELQMLKHISAHNVNS